MKLNDWIKAVNEAAVEGLMEFRNWQTTNCKTAGRGYWGKDSLPSGAEILGTITSPAGESGALVALGDGRFGMGRAGSIQGIPRDAV